MWFKDEVLYPRFMQSVLWMILFQYVFSSSFFFFFKILSWHPVYGVVDWVICNFHWKTIMHQSILSISIIAFGVLNARFSAVEKHINSTRLEKIYRSLSPYCLQHVFSCIALGGLTAFCYDNLFLNFQNSSFIFSWLSSNSHFEQSFIIGHGCFTGIMFSLKYFICNLYLIKFNLNQESKVTYVRNQMYDIMKESFFCVIKAILWYYLVFIIFGSPLKIITFSYFGNLQSENEGIYNLISLKLFLASLVTGISMTFIWSLYLIIFNAFVAEHYKFPIKLPLKGEKNRTLSSALACKESHYIKYLAVLDLRLLSQFDPQRREQMFSISHPGGHPHEWKSISGICISLLQDFLNRLSEYTFKSAASDTKSVAPKNLRSPYEKMKLNDTIEKPSLSLFEKLFCYFREKPAVSYFFDELPNAKLMKLFATSQPFIWIIDALGFLVSVSYSEDKYGVVQQTLPEIIRLLLDIKMAEEKMPVGLVGIRTYVKDPQGRYEHIHQRLSLRTTVNNALCRIAHTFKEDINGIYLPEEYQKYFQRYLGQKN